jgi:hypothetical protein
MKASLNDIVRNNTLSPARVANALDAGKVFVATGTDTYAVTVGLGIASYVLGDKYSVQIPNANTGTTPTLNVSTIGAVNIKDNEGNNLAIGDLKANGIYEFVYDGTNFRVINIGGGGTGAADLDDVLTLGNDGGGIEIENIADPSAPQSAATRAYVDSRITTGNDIFLNLNFY